MISIGGELTIILIRSSIYSGFTRSLSWLKRRLRALNLRRRVPDPPNETIKALIKVLLMSLLHGTFVTFFHWEDEKRLIRISINLLNWELGPANGIATC